MNRLISFPQTKEQLIAASNALNEILNGPDAIDELEFHARIGISREEAQKLNSMLLTKLELLEQSIPSKPEARYQHIGISLVNENGGEISYSDANFAAVLKILETIAGSKILFPWLSTIDPYGDTIVNSLQREHFTSELRKLKEEFTETESVEAIDKALEMINHAGVHEYIKFIGD